jgi:hypothetical protein
VIHGSCSSLGFLRHCHGARATAVPAASRASAPQAPPKNAHFAHDHEHSRRLFSRAGRADLLTCSSAVKFCGLKQIDLSREALTDCVVFWRLCLRRQLSTVTNSRSFEFPNRLAVWTSFALAAASLALVACQLRAWGSQSNAALERIARDPQAHVFLAADGFDR